MIRWDYWVYLGKKKKSGHPLWTTQGTLQGARHYKL